MKPPRGLLWNMVLGAFLVFLLAYGVVFAWLALQTQRDDSSGTYDVVIVLGARAYFGGRINPCLQARVEKGAAYVLDNPNTPMIATGGIDLEDGASEASVMQDIALGLGVPAKGIILEPQATSTLENLRFSQRIMQARGLKNALIVSEPFHLPRSSLIAGELGLAHGVAAASDSPCWSRWKMLSRWALREPLALFENALRRLF